jgi:hypothetical protein
MQQDIRIMMGYGTGEEAQAQSAPAIGWAFTACGADPGFDLKGLLIGVAYGRRQRAVKPSRPIAL